MAETALPEPGAAMSPTDVKQERDILEGLGFSMSPPAATKRPFEHLPGTEEDQIKRVKTEIENHGPAPAPEIRQNPETQVTQVTQEVQENHESHENHDGAEESLEDDLALLVQNALSGVGDLVSSFSQEPDLPQNTSDAMDIDSTSLPEPSLPPPPPAPTSFITEPQKFVRDACWHTLGNIAISILLISSQQPCDDNIKSIRDGESPNYNSLRQLKTAFESTRQIYAAKAILSADELEMPNDDARTILHLANLATYAAWLLEGGLKAIAEAHENFHSVFPGQMSDLSPETVELYLALKTQLAIEKLLAKAPEQHPDGILNEVLVNGLEDKLRGLHGGFDLTAADQSFISSLRSRRESLQGLAHSQLEAGNLREKYPADEVIRSFCANVKSRLSSAYELGKSLGHSMSQPEESAIDLLPNDEHGDLDLDDLSSFFEKTTSGLVQNALAGLTEEEPAPVLSVETSEQPVTEPTKSPPKAEASVSQTNGITDFAELEALVAESTSNYVKTTLHGLSPVPYQPTVPTSTSKLFTESNRSSYLSTAESMAAQPSYLSQLQQHQAQNPYYSYTQAMPEPPQPQPGPGENLPPNQTFPSAILYDKARQAALSKSSAHTRREGMHSTRRPWTQEEEKALMAGLDMVKGPHWSQILTLFGPNGTISDILKDRTQVQLKDKARNLKLFFLKTNSEMPYYLQAVTGELKTRAPTQAARKEAEERARMNSEEEQARIQGIMTLAGGLQNPPPGRTAGSPATAVGSGVVTPAQAASHAQAASTHASAGTQQGHPSHQIHSQTSQGYPPTSLPQSRPLQTTTQKALQSVTQGPPRPQTQMPAQTTRPPSQHQQHAPQQSQAQHQHSPTMHSPAQHQQATVQSRSHTSTPVSQHQHLPTSQNTPNHHQHQHQPTTSTHANHAHQQHYSSQQQQQQHHQQPQQQNHQPPHSSPSTSMQTHPASTMALQHSPTPQSQHDIHDNSAEAALLQGLQAAVAEP